MVESFSGHRERNGRPSWGRLATTKLSKLILTYASSPASEPRPFGGRSREAPLEGEVNEGGGARHAIDDDAFVVVVHVVERGAAARTAEAEAAVRPSDLRGAEAPRAVAGAERRDHSAGMARCLSKERFEERESQRKTKALERERREKINSSSFLNFPFFFREGKITSLDCLQSFGLLECRLSGPPRPGHLQEVRAILV